MFNNEFFFLEKNIININSNEKENIFEKFINKNEFNNNNLIIKDNNDLIENEILDKINKKKINIYFNDKLILEYFENINNNNKIYPKFFPILFNNFVFICYNENKYFYYNIINNIKFNFNFQGKIILFFYDLNNNNNNNKIVFYFLSKNLTLTYFNDNNINKYKLHINNNKILLELNNNNNFKYNSIYKCFINNKNYLIFSIKNFFLLFNTNNNKNYKLINFIEISNNYITFLYKNNICLLTKEKIIFEIKIISNKNNNNKNNQLFKNISLKENKNNYNELLIKIKILLYYEIMINKNSFNEIKKNKKILEIFNNYKISNYIENLNNSINKDNIYFFLKINLNDEILQCIIIYSLIFKEFTLFKKIFNLLDLNDLIIFKIYIKSFIQNFFIDFQNNNNINIDNIINEIIL